MKHHFSILSKRQDKAFSGVIRAADAQATALALSHTLVTDMASADTASLPAKKQRMVMLYEEYIHLPMLKQVRDCQHSRPPLSWQVARSIIQ